MSDGCKEEFIFQADFCFTEAKARKAKLKECKMKSSNSHEYKNITLNGCKILCSKVHNDRCNQVIYDWTSKTCLLLPAGICSRKLSSPRDMINTCDILKFPPQLEVYKRQRCPKGMFFEEKIQTIKNGPFNFSKLHDCKGLWVS